MKIKEIMTEGFWSGVGAFGKGLAKGVGQSIAPNAMADFEKQKNLRRGGVTQPDQIPDLPPSIYAEPEPEAQPATDTSFSMAGRYKKPTVVPMVTNKPWTITLPHGTVSRDAQGVWRNDKTGEVIDDATDLKKLNYNAELGVTDPEAQKAIDAKKDADMMARLRAREKQMYEPVDVSQKTQEPIKIGKEVIKPGDPRYAKLAARIK